MWTVNIWMHFPCVILYALWNIYIYVAKQMRTVYFLCRIYMQVYCLCKLRVVSIHAVCNLFSECCFPVQMRVPLYVCFIEKYIFHAQYVHVIELSVHFRLFQYICYVGIPAKCAFSETSFPCLAYGLCVFHRSFLSKNCRRVPSAQFCTRGRGN